MRSASREGERAREKYRENNDEIRKTERSFDATRTHNKLCSKKGKHMLTPPLVGRFDTKDDTKGAKGSPSLCRQCSIPRFSDKFSVQLRAAEYGIERWDEMRTERTHKLKLLTHVHIIFVGIYHVEPHARLLHVPHSSSSVSHSSQQDNNIIS